MNRRFRTVASTALVLVLLALPSLASAQATPQVETRWQVGASNGTGGGVQFFAEGSSGNPEFQIISGFAGGCYFDGYISGNGGLSVQNNSAHGLHISGQVAASTFYTFCPNSSMTIDLTLSPVLLYHGIDHTNTDLPPFSNVQDETWYAAQAGTSGTMCLGSTCYDLTGGSGGYDFATTRSH
jgi:hypothetical protein